jgi:thiol-disulfide isomerase/thioredoxin
MKTVSLLLILCALVVTNFSGCTRSGVQSSVAAPADEPVATFKDLQGHNVSLATWKGKVLFVDFWATWCEACQVEMPSLIGLQKQYGDQGFTIIGVAMDEEGKSVVEPFVQKTHYKTDAGSVTMNFPVVIGNDDIATEFGGLIGMPSSFLISRDGKIVKKFVGVASQDALEKGIRSLL